MPLHVCGKFFERIVAVTVTLDDEAFSVAFNNEIESERSNFPMRRNAVAGGGEALHYVAFEIGLRAIFFFFQKTHESRGIFGVLDELAAEVVSFQVIVRAKGVDNPHLVPRAAGGNVETLLEEFLIAERQGAALGGVNKRDEDDVSLVALELRRVSAEDAMEFVAIGRDTRADEVVDFNGLFVPNERDYAEAHRLTGVILFVFRLFHCSGDKRRHGEGFLAIEFAVAAGASDAVGDGVRAQMNAACITQRLDAAIIGNHVAELDDFWDAAEMFDETSCAAEGLAREIVDGNLAIVEIGVRDAAEILVDKVLDYAKILADSGRADLLVIADDEDGFAEIQSDESHHVALAGFVDDDHIESRDSRVKIFDDTRKRHDPNGDSAAALAHFSCGFIAQERNADAVAFADAANGIKPADERLTLTGRGTTRLRGPGTLINQFDCCAAELLAQFFAFCLQVF